MTIPLPQGERCTLTLDEAKRLAKSVLALDAQQSVPREASEALASFVLALGKPVQYTRTEQIGEIKETVTTTHKHPSAPHRCPVCEGTKTVPAGFYDYVLGLSTVREQCQACKGEGVLWS